MPVSDSAGGHEHRRSIVIVSKQRLLGASNGSSTYLLSIARSLIAAGYAVDLIQPSPSIAGRTPVMRLRPEMALFRRHAIRGAVRFGQLVIFLAPAIWARFASGALRMLLRKAGLRGPLVQDRPAPYAVATPWEKADFAFLKNQLAPGTCAMIADYMFCAPAFAAAGPATAKAIIMHDLFHSREGGAADSVTLVERDAEITMLGRADAVLAIQEKEAGFVADHVPDTRAILVPMPAEPVAAAQSGADDTVMFVASNTAPNIVGLEWFLEEVWPQVLAARPACRLHVAGTAYRAFVGRAFLNVEFLGLVDDLDALYSATGVVISPLTFGSGLKIKLIEALAKGKAIVATSITLQGVETICGPAVMERNDPADFAAAIIALAGSEQDRSALADRALQCAYDHFSASIVHAPLLDWLAQSTAD